MEVNKMSLEELKKQVKQKAKTVEKIIAISSRVDGKEQKWVHLDYVLALLSEYEEKLRKLLLSLYKDYEEYNQQITKIGLETLQSCGLRIARASKFALIQFIEHHLGVKAEEKVEY